MLEKIGVFLLFLLLAVMVVFLLWILLVEVPVDMHAEAKCADLGWPEGTVRWFLRPHCVGWDDGTKIIIPLAEAQPFESSAALDDG